MSRNRLVGQYKNTLQFLRGVFIIVPKPHAPAFQLAALLKALEAAYPILDLGTA